MSALGAVLPTDFVEFVEILNDESVEYLIIGGLAVAFHGHVRATKDLDIYVRPTHNNAMPLLRALKRFGAPTAGLHEQDFASSEIVFQIGVAPVRIDVTTVVDGIDFDQASRTKIIVDFAGVPAPVIGKQALIKNKIACGRPQDLADVAALRSLAKRKSRERKQQ